MQDQRPRFVHKNVFAFWCLGLLNNSLYVVLNAEASKISGNAVGLVYLAGVLPTLMVKLTGPYWFHLVSYKVRVNVSGALMIACLVTVAWGRNLYVQLLGVAFGALQSGTGEATILALASFYNTKNCTNAWASGTGFAGVFGYLWTILFSQVLEASLQLQLMAGLWIPIVWLLVFNILLGEPNSDSTLLGSTQNTRLTAHAQVDGDRSVAAILTFREKLMFTLTLWKYMVPMFAVYAAEYIIQAGLWTAMGFPDVHSAHDRHRWYQFANFTYQLGVFFSRSLGGAKVLTLIILWVGPALQFFLMLFFWCTAATEFGGWWLLAPAFCVGLLGGFVYAQTYVLVSARERPAYLEQALGTITLADTTGTIVADVVAIFAQGCLFGRLNITDTIPAFKCGYNIWRG